MRSIPLVLLLAPCLLAGVQVRIEAVTRQTPALLASLTPEQRALLEKLNHADIEHLAKLRALVVPESWSQDEMAYSPLPETWPTARTSPKALVIDLAAQVFGAYENGKLVRWGPVSTGTGVSRTMPGLYHLNWRSRSRRSTVNPEWLMTWYYNFSSVDGNAMHAYSMPGFPASHGCIRLLERDAQWVYDWGEGWTLDEKSRLVTEGTPLLITGEYRYGAPPPWRTPAWWTQVIELPAMPAMADRLQGK